MVTGQQTSAMVFDFLYYGKTIKLASEFKQGGIVVFQSTTLNLAPPAKESDNTGINIQRGENILLHISIRRRERLLLFSSKPAGGDWSAMEGGPLKGAFYGSQPSITVYDHGDRFQILTDYDTNYYFIKKITGIADSFSYLAYNSPTIPSPLSDPLFVTIYGSFEGMVPAGQGAGINPAGEADPAE